jgi:hypothetical protein
LFHESEQFGCFFREMDISTSEETGITMTSLGGSYDEADFSEIVKTAIKRAHGLQCATGE